MDRLSSVERELVALGAALGSNCVPCIEHHVPAAREAGLDDRQISEALRLADRIRRAPARKVFETAFNLLRASASGATEPAPGEDTSQDAAPAGGADRSCCG